MTTWIILSIVLVILYYEGTVQSKIKPNSMNKVFTATPAQIASLRKQLAANNIAIPDGNSGLITGHGITMSFSYDGTANLSVTILNKPWIPTASMIWEELQNHLNS